MKVLVVDDDGDQRELRSLLLTRAGFDAIPARDKESAKELAIMYRPGAAVVDLALPTIEDGVELIRELSSIHPGIRLVILTGWTRNAAQKQLDGLRIDELFIKPMATAELIRTLRTYEKPSAAAHETY
jgi:DNA-binding response OmpR family regulator